MTTTIGSLDLNAFSDLYNDSNQYFWFESDSSSAWGSGAHVTLYPESQFTDSTNPNYMKGQNIIMNTDGFSIRNGALPMMVLDNDSLDFNAVDTSLGTYTTMASFSSTGAQIGVNNGAESYLFIDYRSMQLIDKEGDAYFHVSDLRDDNGIADVYETFQGNGTTQYQLHAQPYTNQATLYLGGEWYATVSVDTFTWIATVPTILGVEQVLTFKYQTTGSYAKSFTFGTREDYSKPILYGIAPMSFVEGYGNVASGFSSHCEGDSSFATAFASHAEGTGCEARGLRSHAEGYNCKAIGDASHAQNSHTIAWSKNQTVIGAYNTADRNDTYSLIIGNGTSNTALSNALTVDWSGRVQCGDYSGTFKSIFDVFYPVGSYYETSLASAIPSGSPTPNATDLANLGVTWFDPQYAWGGTWELETAGQVHVSSGTGYVVNGALTNTSDGGSPYIQEHSHGFTNPTIASSGAHTHTVTVRYRTGVLASGSAQSQPYANAGHTSNNIAYTPSGGGAHGHTYSANGSVGAVSGASTGQGDNMPPYIIVNRWHRTA